MSSVYVVCWIFLQTFQTYFCIQATVWTQIRLLLRSSLIWVHTVCKNDFWNHKQMTKQTTIVVTGSLRVKTLQNARRWVCPQTKGQIPPVSIADGRCLIETVSGRAHRGPVCGLLVFLLQMDIESCALFYHSGFDYVFHCDVSQMR